MTRKLLFSLAGLALATLADSEPAYSFDYKIYPGSLCQPSKGDEAVNFLRGPGFIYHTNVTAPQPLTVTCPITRDRVPHAIETSEERTRIDAGVHLNFLDPKQSKIDCKFHSLRENGSDVNGSGLTPTSQFIDPTQQLVSIFWDVKPLQTAIDGPYSINCQLPAYVFLLRYTVGEDKSTDDGGF
jgi:hypothetical protein